MPKAKIGSRVQWQSHTEVDSNSRVFDEHWSTSLNLNNVTDQKYLLSLYQAGGSTHYGAPRNLTASVTWQY